MNKKMLWVIIGIVVIILAVGGFAMMHKSKTTTSSSSTKSSTAMTINNSVMMSMNSSSLGQYLADPSNKTLYTYGGDTSGASNCTGSCIASWPPYIDTGATTGLPTDVSTITRSDSGKMQYTYKGMPLYYFESDSAGQVTGNGVGNFTVAKP